ncbi:MAG: hypothetical protein ACOYJA_09810 [Christensenellales bacterium]|jgi:predicted SprT family Zn-dependent metalloprotease
MSGTNPFRNRAGADKLTWLLLALALIFCWSKYTLCLTVVLVAYALYRMFSRDISARRREEAWLMMKVATLAPGFLRTMNARKAERLDKSHKYFSCPKCKARLRAPKGKGRLRITCRTCGEVFEKKT